MKLAILFEGPSRLQKILALYQHPNTPAHEKEAARQHYLRLSGRNPSLDRQAQQGESSQEFTDFQLNWARQHGWSMDQLRQWKQQLQQRQQQRSGQQQQRQQQPWQQQPPAQQPQQQSSFRKPTPKEWNTEQTKYRQQSLGGAYTQTAKTDRGYNEI